MTCPHCNADMSGGLGTYCWDCERYTDDTKPQTPTTAPTLSEEPVDATFTLPWELLVSKNRKRGAVAHVNAKEYRERVQAMARWFENEYTGGPHTDEVHVALELYPPNERSDGPNFEEALFDALEHAKVIQNDKLITRWEGVVFYADKDNPRAFVSVERRAA